MHEIARRNMNLDDFDVRKVTDIGNSDLRYLAHPALFSIAHLQL